MAGDVTLTAANAIAHSVQTGQLRADPTLVQKRVGICHGCPHLNKGRCNVCGCFVSTKAGLVVSKCPLKKW